MVRWYMQCSSSLPYMLCKSSMPLGPTGSSTCATMFWISQFTSANCRLGKASLRMPHTCRLAKTHSYQFRPPVTTSLPEPKRSVVQSGDRSRMVMAANRCLS
jgi:hypothetical protein